MNLEECVKVKLYVVDESSHMEQYDIYDYECVNWHHEEPMYFSSKNVAEQYKSDRAVAIKKEGYKEYEPGEFCGKRDHWNRYSLSTSIKQVKKDNIMKNGNKQYYFDKSDNRMYEIHDKLFMREKIEDNYEEELEDN